MPDDGVLSWALPTMSGERLARPATAGDAAEAVAAAFVSTVNTLRPSDIMVHRLYGASERVVTGLQETGLVGSDRGLAAWVGGAVGRRTAIHVDGVVPTTDLFLPVGEDQGGSPAAALARVARAVVESGLGCAIPRPDGRAVAFQVEELPIAVIPVVRRGERLMVPGRDHEGLPQWVVHDPGAEVAFLRHLDTSEGPRPRRLLALLKAWRMRNRVPVSGFALEILVGAFFQAGKSSASLPVLFEAFMAWARGAIPGVFPVPSSDRRLMVGHRVQGAALSAYWRAVRARHLAAAGDLAAASVLWRDLLGTPFPRLVCVGS